MAIVATYQPTVTSMITVYSSAASTTTIRPVATTTASLASGNAGYPLPTHSLQIWQIALCIFFGIVGGAGIIMGLIVGWVRYCEKRKIAKRQDERTKRVAGNNLQSATDNTLPHQPPSIHNSIRSKSSNTSSTTTLENPFGDNDVELDVIHTLPGLSQGEGEEDLGLATPTPRGVDTDEEREVKGWSAI